MFSRIIVTKKIHKWNIQFQKYEMKRYMDGSVGTRNSIAWYSLFVVRRHVVGPHIMFPKFKYYKYYTYHREKLHQRRYRKTRAKKIWPYTSFIRSPNHWNHGRLAVSSIWLDSYLQHLSVWTKYNVTTGARFPSGTIESVILLLFWLTQHRTSRIELDPFKQKKRGREEERSEERKGGRKKWGKNKNEVRKYKRA